MTILVTIALLIAAVDAASLIPTSGGWKPISDPGLGAFQTLDKISSGPYVAPSFGEIPTDDGIDGQCALYKVTFTQDLYFQVKCEWQTTSAFGLIAGSFSSIYCSILL